MTGQYNGHAQFAIQGAHQSKYLGRTDRIELRGGLIEYKHMGLESESGSDREPLFLPA
jgi:hypothetical protein